MITRFKEASLAIGNLPDKMLMLRCQRGDGKAFGWLYKKYLDKLYRYAYFKLGQDEAAAEDMVQQTFFKAWEKRQSFDPSRGTVQAWLYRIAHNLIVDHYREYGKLVATDEEAMAQLSDETEDVQSRLIREEGLMELRGAMKSLSDEQRTAVHLRYVEEISYSQISFIMGRKEEAVRALVSRGLKKLEEQLKK